MNKPQSNIKKRILSVDWLLIFIVLVAVGYGLMLVKSATNHTNSSRDLMVQGASFVLGFFACLFMSSLDYDHVLKYSKYFYAISVAALILTLFIGVGEEGTDIKRWIRIPGLGIGIQTSEIAKIIFIVTLAKHIDSVKEHINKPLNVLGLIAHVGVVTGLVLMEHDLGTALVFAFIFFVMCFVSGISLWYLFATLFLVVVLSPFIWQFMGDYQRDRILVWIDPAYDPNGAGWHIRVVKEAIGSGGIFGQGYQKGYMTQNYKVFAQETDMIYAVVGEEFGIFGTLLVILIFTFLLLRIFRTAKLARNDTGMLLCMGVLAMFMFQSLINIGMCIGLVPVTGITLPFFSYGGSSMLSSFLGIGIVLSVYSRRGIYYFNQNEDI